MAPRILFFGYSEVGYECLSLLIERGDNVIALVTHEDSPDEKIWFKTPAIIAREKSLPIFAPEHVNAPEWIERIAALRPDLILSVYYRTMIGSRILALPRLGAFNVHGSLLPRYRGRAPINWAVLHGETRIGMTLHRMVRRADAGAIVDQEGIDLGPRDSAAQAFRKVLPCARQILARQIDALLAGTARETPQDEARATYFGGRTPEDGRIQWSQTSAQIFNLVRAVTDPYPGAFTDVAGARLMVWWAESDSAAVREAVGRSAGNAESGSGTDGTGNVRTFHSPGEILSIAPLVVATADGAIELTQVEWRGSPAAPLHTGQLL
jgi:methionyl-tRNA formyltransferase